MILKFLSEILKSLECQARLIKLKILFWTNLNLKLFFFILFSFFYFFVCFRIVDQFCIGMRLENAVLCISSLSLSLPFSLFLFFLTLTLSMYFVSLLLSLFPYYPHLLVLYLSIFLSLPTFLTIYRQSPIFFISS